MSAAHTKDLILKLAEGCPCESEIPLDVAPETAFDVGVSLICPACGSTYAQQRQVEDAVVADCPRCGCEFCPPMESMAKRIVNWVQENKRHCQHLLDIPTARHAPRKRRSGGIGASREMAHKLLSN
jgi:hypothetical protein